MLQEEKSVFLCGMKLDYGTEMELLKERHGVTWWKVTWPLLDDGISRLTSGKK
jgi:hypothetical protein